MVSKSVPWKLHSNILLKVGKGRQAVAVAVQDNFFILVIVRMRKTARELFTNLFAWLQKGTPLRHIDGDERLEELTCQVWVDELACTAEKGARFSK